MELTDHPVLLVLVSSLIYNFFFITCSDFVTMLKFVSRYLTL